MSAFGAEADIRFVVCMVCGNPIFERIKEKRFHGI